MNILRTLFSASPRNILNFLLGRHWRLMVLFGRKRVRHHWHLMALKGLKETVCCSGRSRNLSCGGGGHLRLSYVYVTCTHTRYIYLYMYAHTYIHIHVGAREQVPPPLSDLPLACCSRICARQPSGTTLNISYIYYITFTEDAMLKLLFTMLKKITKEKVFHWVE